MTNRYGVAKKDLQLELAKSNLSRLKEVYDNNIEALAKYCDNLGMRTVRAEDLKSKALLKVMEAVRNKPSEFHKFLFGDVLPKGKVYTEVDRMNNEAEYITKLNKWAEYILKDLNLNIRKKMAEDMVKDMYEWNLFFDDLAKLNNEFKDDKTKGIAL